MPNAVYDVVCDALSRIVSRRAAENIVREALRGGRMTPEQVTAEQMQSLLKSVVFVRLQQIIPVAQAKGEIRQILGQLEQEFAANRSLPPEVQEGWLALRDEFAKIGDQLSPRAVRLAGNIAQLPHSADPVRVLNDLWAELDLLQLEQSSDAAPEFSLQPRFKGDLLLESGEFEPLQFQLEHTQTDPQGPTLGRPGAVAVARIDQDLNLTIIDELPPPIFESVSEAEVTSIEFDPVAPLEFSLPLPETVVPKKPKIAVLKVKLDTPEAQEQLLTRFASEEGVTGVLLSGRAGDVIASRLSSGSANHLAGVVAATTLLLIKRHSFRVFYTHLESVSAFIAPLEDKILTVLADKAVNVGRVFTELESLKETA